MPELGGEHTIGIMYSIVYWGYIGIMENKMEPAIVDFVCRE